jgi:hypothetical protein
VRSAWKSPKGTPELDVKAAGPTSIALRAHNGDALVRRLPPQVLGMTVWTFIGEVAPMDYQEWTVHPPFTKPTVTIDFGAIPLGSRVWVAACWYNTHGQGPMSLPVDMHLTGLSLTQQIAQQQEPQGPQLVGEDPMSEAA